ncbi:MAG: tetratricopeptide repeat protein [Candidatus Cloacimonadota bacterium]|nr:MAG: tetratricopeptide repeat protein [Candidatus Cloacimonadota bacterium]
MAENNEGLPPEIEKLSERLAKDPKSLVFSSLANAYRKNNMVDEAIDILQKGLEIHPNYASARIVLGRCYTDKRMYEMAKVEFNKALENDPQNIVVLEKLGEVYKTLNQNEDAYDVYKKLLELDPPNETFEREVESLKNLVEESIQKSTEYDSFQTIPEQKVATPDTPTLTEIFEDTPPVTEKSSETIVTEVEEKKEEGTEPVTSTFSEMFEEQPPASEEPVMTQEKQEVSDIETSVEKEEPVEEKPPVDLETPMVAEPPKETEQLAEEQPPKEEEHPQEVKPPKAVEPLEGMTSIFEKDSLETTQAMPEQEAPAETEKFVFELSKELEKEEVVSPVDTSQESLEEVKEPGEEKEKPTATETLAKIYLSQGFVDEALNIYKELLSNDPENENFKNKIEELEKQTPEEAGPQEQPPQIEQKERGSSQEQPPQMNPLEEAGTQEQPPQISPLEERDSKEITEEEERKESKNLDNFQDWLKKMQP